MRPPGRTRSAGRRSGLTLVETCIGVSILGIVLAVFIPTFVRKLRTSKIAEASEQLEALYQASAAYYQTAQRIPGRSSRISCLPERAGPAPPMPSASPTEVDFSAPSTPGWVTWKALGFQPRYEVRYSYRFEPAAAGCDLAAPPNAALLRLRAEGDLDGDGARSTFEREAVPNARGELVPRGVLHIIDRVE